MIIAVLEDNGDRTAEMDRLLADKFPFYQRKFLRTACEALPWIEENWQRIICLSLDHDLEPCSEYPSVDPGIGRDVSSFVAAKEPAFPVVLHTTNATAAIGMESDLSENGWNVQRVLPYDDLAWISEAWLPAVRNAIVSAAVSSVVEHPPASAAPAERR
jgi:hypothetical protein